MKKIPGLILACIFFLSFSVVNAAAFSENQAKIFYIKGNPNIMKEGLPVWKACKPGMQIDSGDRVKTEKGEEVEISFLTDRSNIVRIEEDTDAYIRKSRAPYRIELLNGAVMALIKKLPKGSTFEIATPVGLSGARGTGWRSSTGGASADFKCYENAIYVRGFDQSGNMIEGALTVDSGWGTFLEKFEKPERLGKLSEDDLAGWNKWKNELEGRLKDMEHRLDRAGSLQNKINELESQKLDVKESRDTERADQRQESKQDNGGYKYDGPN
ncbi:MAG: FecR family protein [Candidatus Omnitrophota bacterium]|nr:FecR family protein [Candidatus Omnitrophota bacterium]